MPSKKPKAGRCGAQLRKKPGQYCLRKPLIGRTRCRLHGGASLVGIASPSFVHGKYSGALSDSAAVMFASRADDPTLLSLRDDIALADVMLIELVTEAQAGGSSKANWETADELITEYDRINADEKMSKDEKIIGIRTIMTELWALIRAGKAGIAHRKRVTDQMIVRKNLIESERKRMVEAGMMIDLVHARNVINAISHLVREHVHDPEALRKIADGIGRYVGSGREAGDPSDAGQG